MGDVVDFEIGKPHGFNGDGYTAPEQIISSLPNTSGGVTYDANADCYRPSDPIKHPSHYNRNGIEAWDIIEHIIKDYLDPTAAYHVGSIIKYIYRAPHKGNPDQDLRKMAEHAQRLVKHLDSH